MARDLVVSFYQENSTDLVNNGVPIYYGFCLTEKVYQLTILGETPTEIIPITFNNEAFYFWYFTEIMSEFSKKLQSISSFEDQNITYQYIIDLLEVKLEN